MCWICLLWIFDLVTLDLQLWSPLSKQICKNLSKAFSTFYTFCMFTDTKTLHLDFHLKLHVTRPKCTDRQKAELLAWDWKCSVALLLYRLTCVWTNHINSLNSTLPILALHIILTFLDIVLFCRKTYEHLHYSGCFIC